MEGAQGCGDSPSGAARLLGTIRRVIVSLANAAAH